MKKQTITGKISYVGENLGHGVGHLDIYNILDHINLEEGRSYKVTFEEIQQYRKPDARDIGKRIEFMDYQGDWISGEFAGVYKIHSKKIYMRRNLCDDILLMDHNDARVLIEE